MSVDRSFQFEDAVDLGGDLKLVVVCVGHNEVVSLLFAGILEVPRVFFSRIRFLHNEYVFEE